MIRVVIADDSAFLRQVLQEELQASQKIRVVGLAKNGKEALELVKRVRPDLLILDCEMPVMNGLECLRRLQKEACPVPVFMFSSLTYEGASVTIQALEYGALDFFQKPKNGVQGLEGLIETLVKKIEFIVRYKKTARKLKSARFAMEPKGVSPRVIDLIALGSSTGGVQAAHAIIPKLPKDIQPIVWVQHMPPKFTASLAKRLDDLSLLRVKEASDGEMIEQGTCYLAPGGIQMRVEKVAGGYRLRLRGTEKVSGHCPSCDVLFGSVARYFTSNSLGVILTGMGHDGTEGLKKMRERGTFIIGQNEASCTVYGMPRAAWEAGAVDVQMDLHAIAQGITRVCYYEKESCYVRRV